MSSRKRRVGGVNRLLAITATVLIHALIIGALFFKFTKEPKTVEAAYAEKVDVVKATTIDAADLEREKEKLKQKDLEKKRKEQQERERLEKLKKQAEEEQQRIEDLKKQQEQEKKKADELEKKRKEIALKKKKEEEKRKKEEAERKRKEEAQRKKKEAAEKKRKAEEAERKRRLEESLAAEEAFQAEQRAKQITTTVSAKYSALIKNSVQSKLVVPVGITPIKAPLVNVKLSSFGDVRSVRILESSGDLRYDRAVEAAVLKATPLPIPPAQEYPQLNKEYQDLSFRFRR